MLGLFGERQVNFNGTDWKRTDTTRRYGEVKQKRKEVEDLENQWIKINRLISWRLVGRSV
jgi:hypothetical protein